jgi:hypothetical protein
MLFIRTILVLSLSLVVLALPMEKARDSGSGESGIEETQRSSFTELA